MANLVLSASATTTGTWFELKGRGGHGKGAVLATITTAGTFGSSRVLVQTSPDGGTHSVDVALDPQSVNTAFITSGQFSSAGAVNVEVGYGQYIRAVARVSADASASPISAFIAY